MTDIDADKSTPDIELRGEEAKKALTQKQNPLLLFQQAINNHAQEINKLRKTVSENELDIKANKANMEIFDKRFGLIERQLDNLEKELSRIKDNIK